ncbi:hypothetical protein C0993_010386 [Termitomyces sp. T159_Od127]|nr:hypothetical protein C0993_010386 [Termitomyces sp. T159_Od127]
MSQLANPDTPPVASAPQDEAWTRLLHLEIQVQLTQASLIHHMIELSTLRQTTNHIFQSLQALLERLPPCTAPPLVAKPSLAALAVSAAALGVPAGPWVQLPRLTLSDTYNGDCTSGERFLQSCLTYIHLSGDAFDFNTLKIAWVLFYMKAEQAFTYALHVLQRPEEFFPIDLAKSAALALHNREQYRQEKQMLDEYIDSFRALVEQAAYPDGLQLCLTFQDGLHPALMKHIDNFAEGHSDDKQIAS